MDYSIWEEEVRAYEARKREDVKQSPHPIVFYGSSTIRLWDTLAEDFADKPVVNRGFGGSNIEEATHFVPRLVLPLHPRQVVFYSGENDLAQGRPIVRIQQDYRRFVAAVRVASLAPIALISVKPSPGRWEMKARMDELNACLRDWCGADATLTFVDLVQAMLKDGEPRAELWVEDGIHLTPAGYKFWAQVLRPHLI